MTPEQLMTEANQLPPEALGRLGLIMFPQVKPPADTAEAIVMECACRFIAFMTGYRPEAPK